MSPEKAEPTRVLVLIKGLGLGGAENLIAEAVESWDRERFEYHVAYMLPWKDQLVPRLEEQDVPVHCLGWDPPAPLRTAGNLRGLVAEWRPQIIHSHLPAASIIARLAVPGTPHVYSEHNIVDYYRRPTRWMNRITYAMNDAVVAVSKAVADSVTGYPGKDPHVVPNGIAPLRPARSRSDIRKELVMDPDTYLVVHVGNIRPHKGHRNLIAAAEMLDTTVDALIVSIGGEKFEGDLSRLDEEVRGRRLENRIRFLGRREDAIDFIAAADLVVNPADVEGLPLTLLEALALGKPVVATSVGGVPTIIKDRETGILVPAKDPSSLASAISFALSSPDASSWGQAGAKLVAERHGIDDMIRRYEEIYSGIVNV